MTRILCMFVVLTLSVTCALAQAPTSRPESRRQSFEPLAAMLGPVRADDPRDLQRCVDLAAMKMLDDPRLFPVDVRVEMDPRGPGLTGYTLFREQRNPLFGLIRAAAGVDVWDTVASGAILPGLQYGIVTADRAALRSKPEPRSEMVTQVSRGDPLFLLEARGDYVRCLGPEGYSGFIASAELRRIDGDTLTTALNSAPPSDRIEPAIQKAVSLQGTRYVWGGTTGSGIDCSGLVQTSFKSIGVNLPRDADQQVYAGRLVATRWHRHALRRGDLLFFLGRRGTITHVAIYLGDHKYIEAGEQDVHISSFKPGDEGYNERREGSFCFGKRVLD
jgi:hypothetical protein